MGKAEAKNSVQSNVKAIYGQLDMAIAKIRTSSKISKASIESMHRELIQEINKAVKDVKGKLEKQKAAEEQERLRKIQEEMERERKRKEEEEKRLKEAEAERKIKAEMEAKRKIEEQTINHALEADRRAASEIQEKLNEENRKLNEENQQERRDHELALRLARESKSGVDDLVTSTTPPRSLNENQVSPAATPVAQKSKAKYDLSNWKYAELRDTINTSCDIDLLEACREEFHRRLKVYHAWKAKNRKTKNGSNGPPGSSGMNETENMRAPSSVMAAAANTGAIAKDPSMRASNSLSSDQQRYFRIPFAKPLEGQENSLSPSHQPPKGWWYAHFDGDWIARQMEITPESKPVLLVAGKDDMRMCELSLNETGLTRKRGAEILENEFEKAWQSNGGRAYVRPSARQTRK